MPGGRGRIRDVGTFEDELNSGPGSRGESIGEEPKRTRCDESGSTTAMCLLLETAERLAFCDCVRESGPWRGTGGGMCGCD